MKTLTILLGLLLLIANNLRGDDGDKAIDLARIDARIKPADREHWAFRKVQKPPVPTVKDTAWVRNPVDAFILTKMEEKNWKPSPAATAPATPS